MKKTANTGRFVWYELLTTDPDAAVPFYGDVVGWKTERWESGDYTLWVAPASRRSRGRRLGW